MEQKRQLIARAIYHHRSRQDRQVTLIVLRHQQDGIYALLQSDTCCQQPEYWEGSRTEVLEQWRHFHRALQSEWFLHDKLVCSDADFAEFISVRTQ